jgi:hypothetical protein
MKFFHYFLNENLIHEDQNFVTPIKIKSHEDGEFPHGLSTRYKTAFSSSQEEEEDPVVLVMCDVPKNISEGNENIYEPNLFYHRSDIYDSEMIQEILNNIRFHFNLIEDDSIIFKQILLPLNFDLDDIFRYLADPANNSSKYI